MSETTNIEWTDATWNPIWGCSRVSKGCRHCYAEQIAGRFSGPGKPYEGLVHKVGKEWRWTGELRLAKQVLKQPLHWQKPKRIFVNSMSDLFHEKVSRKWLDQIFAVMALCPHHTFQILTKRPERMLDYISGMLKDSGEIPYYANLLGKVRSSWLSDAFQSATSKPLIPMENVWLGVSVEDQDTADERIPLLMQTPAAVRFISAEPLLGPVYLEDCYGENLDWVIAGGESGRDARAMDPFWARLLRDQCIAGDIPFFFKQWGSWKPLLKGEDPPRPCPAGLYHGDQNDLMAEVGKRRAGRMLDGREWNEFPDERFTYEKFKAGIAGTQEIKR